MRRSRNVARRVARRTAKVARRSRVARKRNTRRVSRKRRSNRRRTNRRRNTRRVSNRRRSRSRRVSKRRRSRGGGPWCAHCKKDKSQAHIDGCGSSQKAASKPSTNPIGWTAEGQKKRAAGSAVALAGNQTIGQLPMGVAFADTVMGMEAFAPHGSLDRPGATTERPWEADKGLFPGPRSPGTGAPAPLWAPKPYENPDLTPVPIPAMASMGRSAVAPPPPCCAMLKGMMSDPQITSWSQTWANTVGIDDKVDAVTAIGQEINAMAEGDDDLRVTNKSIEDGVRWNPKSGHWEVHSYLLHNASCPSNN